MTPPVDAAVHRPHVGTESAATLPDDNDTTQSLRLKAGRVLLDEDVPLNFELDVLDASARIAQGPPGMAHPAPGIFKLFWVPRKKTQSGITCDAPFCLLKPGPTAAP